MKVGADGKTEHDGITTANWTEQTEDGGGKDKNE